jgi:hypothetical protein
MISICRLTPELSRAATQEPGARTACTARRFNGATKRRRLGRIVRRQWAAMPDEVSAKTALLPPTAPDVTARSGRWHPEPAACPKALWPRGLHPSEKTHGESVRRDALTGAKSTDARQATRGVELASRPSRMNIGPGQCRLTPELSRAAKRRRLGRIVRCAATDSPMHSVCCVHRAEARLQACAMCSARA